MDTDMRTTQQTGPDAAAPSTRRDVLRRLAALSLAAAGGTLLAPPAADGKGKSKAKGDGAARKRRHGSAGPAGDRQAPGEEASPTEEAPPEETGGDGQPGERLALPDMPDPRVSATLRIGTYLQNAGEYPVDVTGSIAFAPELVDLMRGGRQFRLTCSLWTLDDNQYEDNIATLQRVSGTTVFTATNGRTFGFRNFVKRSLLDEDQVECGFFSCSGNHLDDIVAVLYLQTRRTASSPWIDARLANGLNYYRTNVIERVL